MQVEKGKGVERGRNSIGHEHSHIRIFQHLN